VKRVFGDLVIDAPLTDCRGVGYNAVMGDPAHSSRITLRDMRRWAGRGEKFAMLTCYDATMAKWLWRGGVKTMLVGDTASQMILGYDSTLPVKMPFMLQITAAVRRGAPDALIMADMPFASYQCGDDEAVGHACAFLAEGHADLVKLEVNNAFTQLVRRMTDAGIPVVAHIGSRPQTVRATGGFQSTGRTERVADIIVDTAQLMIAAGAVALLLEAVPDEVSRRVVAIAKQPGTNRPVPVVGCGAGPACHGHVVVLHDLLGLSDWQPPFAAPEGNIGPQIQETAASWVKKVHDGRYLADGGPYRMK
jgi:3-methyl-2-oxobutanoate hydroxymethyltransferase